MAKQIQPTFIVIGAAKCGTTSLCELMDQHPDVLIAQPKEPDFFTAQYGRGWPWYEERFQAYRGERAIGEGSVSYSWTGVYPEAPSRIAHHLPDAKLIYIVRHPIDRIVSHWVENENNGKNPGPLPEAVRNVPSLMDASRYWRQIENYRAHFSDDQLLVLFFEDLATDPDLTLRRCFDFVGVDPRIPIADADKPRNTWKAKHQDTPLLKRMRGITGFDQIRDNIPTPVRNGLRSMLKQRLTKKPTWDESSRRWVAEQLRDDTQQFLERCGKPPDYWSLEEPLDTGGQDPHPPKNPTGSNRTA